MSKVRRKYTPVIPSSMTFDIPETYQQTRSMKHFLLMDFFLRRGKERVLVFSSDQQLEILFSSDTIFMDGTFDITPAPFKQVYIIHAHKFEQGTIYYVTCIENIMSFLLKVYQLPFVFCPISVVKHTPNCSNDSRMSLWLMAKTLIRNASLPITSLLYCLLFNKK